MRSNTANIRKDKTPEELAEIRNKRKQSILVYVINSDKGASIKEMASDLNIPAPTCRVLVKEIMEEGHIYALGHADKSKAIIYIDENRAPGAKAQSEEVIKDRDEDLKKCGGREFTEVKPAIHVNQGDVVWISSRSGDGQFFRYLVVTPWERKATVIGIIPEGHPILNLNDTRFVEIGTDPETGEALYADLSNFCSRAYAQFGEELMKIDQEHMTDLKERLARYHRIDISDPAEIERLKRINNESTRLFTDTQRRYESLHQNFAKLVQENQNLSGTIDEKNQAIKKLESDYKTLENDFLEYREKYQLEDDVPEQVASLLWKVSLLEKELEGKNEMIDLLKKIIFKAM